MLIYKGKKDAIVVPIIMFIIFLLAAIVGYVFLPHSFAIYFLIAILLILAAFSYQGTVLKIVLNDKKLVIAKLLSRKVISISDIAFCVIHGLDEEKSLIYAFVRQKSKGMYTVKGIRPKLPFDEVVKKVNDESSNTSFDINFNLAEKIPVSFVENGEELKNEIIERISENQREKS